jgi:hypothetical protein
MMYRVLTGRLRAPQGSVVSADDLGGNINLLVQVGHVEPVYPQQKTKKVQEPEPVPALEDDSADEPEEQD